MRWSLCFAILVGMSQSVTIVGAGLAGSEAALQLADRGVRVRLVEMRPKTPRPSCMPCPQAVRWPSTGRRSPRR